jgi:hypothetical protein
MIDRRRLSLRPVDLGRAVARKSHAAVEALLLAVNEEPVRTEGDLEVFDNFSGLKLAESVSLSRSS